ncbi:hypothetical protein MPL3356_140189 [Mesorhizobium plurifarium]|uniref:Uncharacterized protein n=1 Tax=Mesorhizobium plurifarium TaxID=69974 RepID=A0A090F299_MESPL|nr:hypothetical protein MPL3356_140189 [Mesorhizobium plurifarium]
MNLIFRHENRGKPRTDPWLEPISPKLAKKRSRLCTRPQLPKWLTASSKIPDGPGP